MLCYFLLGDDILQDDGKPELTLETLEGHRCRVMQHGMYKHVKKPGSVIWSFCFNRQVACSYDAESFIMEEFVCYCLWVLSI